MAGQNNLITSKYYSGQGAVLVSDRDALGNPLGFTHLGNVSELVISLEITELEHKESTTGARATDLSIVTENIVNVSVTVENVTAETLKFALFGSSTNAPSASVTDLLARAGLSKTSITDHINISGVIVDRSSDADALFNAIADADFITIDGDVYTCKTGGPEVNDFTLKEFGLGASDQDAIDNLIAVIVGQTATLTYEARNSITADTIQLYAVTPGTAGDSLTLTESTTAARITVSGSTFANGGPMTETTDFLINDKGGSIFVVATSNIPDDTNIFIDYTYAAHTRVEAFTAGKVNKWLRFEGLNTARSNKAVIVDVFNFSPKPLNEQALINDELTQLVIEGTAQADLLRPATESQFFREMFDEN